MKGRVLCRMNAVVRGAVVCALLLPAGFFCGCDQKALPAATKEAWKVTDPAAYAELDKRRYHPEPEDMGGETVSAPPGLVSPELYPLTERIYTFIREKGVPESPGPYELKAPSLPGAALPMAFLPGGRFLMGSPPDEAGRGEDEGPVHEVEVSPFWISTIEIPWELYQTFMDNGRPRSKDGRPLEAGPGEGLEEEVSQPTAPYTAMNLGMGNGYEKGFPAIAMSHYAAAKFCEWLSAQTGEYYRLPTEAEWEYACRAGTKTPYSFGLDAGALPEYAWFYDNGQDQYQRTASRKPNAWGLHDMHGNVAEWVLDSYAPYPASPEGSVAKDPIHLLKGAPHVVRGGSWDDDAPALRSAARRASAPEWNAQDPQNPKSLWYLTNGGMIGFRIVRPLAVPDAETMHRYWNSSRGEP